MKKLAISVLLALTVQVGAAIEFGDIAADYPLYTDADPFAIAAATNALVHATNNAAIIANWDALKLNVTDGASTNQTIVSGSIIGNVLFDSYAFGWDSNLRTFSFDAGNGVTGNINHELWVNVMNHTGATITNGMVVRYAGTVGASGLRKGALMVANGSVLPGYTLGLATEDIPNGGMGKVTSYGVVHDLKTGGNPNLYGEDWSDLTNGAPVYVSTNKPGFLTRYEPLASCGRKIVMGSADFVHNTQGFISVRPKFFDRPEELDGVDGTPPTEGSVMVAHTNDCGLVYYDFDRNWNEFVTNRVKTVFDTLDPNKFTRWENGTGTVYEITGPFTNLQVVLSSNFEYGGDHTIPSWRTNSFPFLDYPWEGIYSDEFSKCVITYYDTAARWESVDLTMPSEIIPFSGDPVGTATVSIVNIYYSTNALYTLATSTQLGTAIDSLSIETGQNLTNAINAIQLDPITVRRYGDSSITNYAGYAVITDNNPVSAQTIVMVPATTIATNVAKFRYDIGNSGFVSASAVSYGRGNSVVGIMQSLLTLYNSTGVPLVSNLCAVPLPISAASVQPWFTNNLVYSASHLTNGYLVMEYTLGTTNTSGIVCQIASGGATSLRVDVQTKPLVYMTHAQGVGSVNGGATNITDGVTSGTYSDTTRTLDIAPILASPYSPWTTNLWAELGTATVSYACGNQPSLVCTNATVITVDSTGFGTSGVGRVALSLYSGTNSVTFLTNAVDYSTTPTLVTNAWNTILFRRVSADRWKGAQLQ